MTTWAQHFSRSIWFQIIWSNCWISVLKKCNPPPPRVFRMGKCCRRLQNVTFFHTPRAVSYCMDTCWGKKENCWRAIFSWLRLIPGYKFKKTRQMDSLDDVTTTFVPSTQKCSGNETESTSLQTAEERRVFVNYYNFFSHRY